MALMGRDMGTRGRREGAIILAALYRAVTRQCWYDHVCCCRASVITWLWYFNASGIPIIAVCMKAYPMDNAAEDQALSTVCLAYGAALFYIAPTQPTTYALLKSYLLKSYLLHGLYTVPPPPNPPPTSPNTVSAPAIVGSTKVPFNHRANVLDRDAVMVPSGWDSWGKINVLRDGFDPAQVEKNRKVSLGRYIAKSAGQEPEEDGGEPLEDFWQALLRPLDPLR
ncbi:hypothetical protein L202_08476 [Cryptococcus amylolentus CBS 6039]|uniref:Uncharacterized protein n=1 Tax=Cryptococcus amylolentus CBS 6039 TaxID=1295533 RepID=A0A1E3H9Q1_9TREE|nr:hypothetical protein L202_08476 [Cryptococcus amylolentus CBS 6039]ODN73082.1 hypothetical protein L202_08476 [Cryptococcus amylolentus CBS 6039]